MILNRVTAPCVTLCLCSIDRSEISTLHRVSDLIVGGSNPVRSLSVQCPCWMKYEGRSEKKVLGFSGSQILISLMIGVLVPTMNFYQLVDIFAQSLL